MKEVIDVKISSGTLKKKYNEALKTNIVCQNALLMVLASMNHDPTYTNEDKLYIENTLIRHNCTKEYIDMVVPQISAKYCPAKHQIDEMLSVLSGTYTFNRYYIEDSRLKSVDWNTIPGKQKRLSLNDKAKAIKQYIYENDKVELVLEAMGCSEVVYHAAKEYWSCTNPDGDNKEAVDINNNPYLGVINWTRNYGGDIYDFIKESKGVDFLQAMAFLCDVLGIDKSENALINAYDTYCSSDWAAYEKTVEEKGMLPLDESELDKYSPTLHIDWFRDGISPWTRKKFDLRYSYLLKRVIIPIRDHISGQLLGMNKRTIVEHYNEFDIPKYLLSKDFKKNQCIYGLWENKKAIKENGFVIVFEGCRSVLKLDTLYQRTKDKKDRSIGVAIFGCILSETQAKILRDLNVNIIISLDKDRPLGEIRYMCSKLKEHSNKKVYYTYDFDGLLDSKDAAIDKGKKVFEAIMKKAVLFDEQEYEKLQEDLGRKPDRRLA